MNSTNRTLMAFGAHADDIELDIAGTLSKYRTHGYEVVYVMTTNNMSMKVHTKNADGTTTSRCIPYPELLPIRKREADAAAVALGTTAIHLNYPQRHYINKEGVLTDLTYGSEPLDGVPKDFPTIITAFEREEEVERVGKMILEANPEAVLSHGHLGSNLEHIASCLLVTFAYQWAKKRGFQGMLLYWHDLAAMTFRLNYTLWDTFIDVTKFWDEKLKLIAIHKSQKPDVHRLDFPDWGAACGCGRAEVFSIADEGVPPEYYSPFVIEIFRNRRT